MKLTVSWSEVDKCYKCPSFGHYSTIVPKDLLEFLVGQALDKQSVEVTISPKPWATCKRYSYRMRNLRRGDRFFTLYGSFAHRISDAAPSALNSYVYIGAKIKRPFGGEIYRAIDSMMVKTQSGRDYTKEWSLVKSAILYFKLPQPPAEPGSSEFNGLALLYLSNLRGAYSRCL